MKFLKRAATCAALASSLTACPGTTSSGEIDSGLPEDKAANELTADETEQLCSAWTDTATETIDGADPCAYYGYAAAALLYGFVGDMASEADLRQACSEAQTSCEEDPEVAPVPPVPPCIEPSETCEATVGEIEECLTDRLEQTEVFLYPAETCSTLTTDGLAEYIQASDEATMATAVCEDVAAACPDDL